LVLLLARVVSVLELHVAVVVRFNELRLIHYSADFLL
jgi:hypothetical protein